MSGKVDVNSAYTYRVLHPMHTVLVSCVDKQGKPNVTTVAWAMPASVKPPLVAISVSPKNYSHDLIMDSGEFVINVPTLEILQETFACGSFSGRSFDKFKKTGLTAMPGRNVKAFAVKECVAHIECKVDSNYSAGDHTIFVGEIVSCYANAGVFTEKFDLQAARLLYHAGGNNFAVLDSKMYKP